MKTFFPYLIIPAAELLLFCLAHGTFASSAQYLLRHFRRLGDFISAETLARALIILLVSDFLAAAAAWSSLDLDTAAQGYLEREDYGGADDEETLQVTLDGNETHELTLNVAARELSEAEIEDAFADALTGIESAVFSNSETLPDGSHAVRSDLRLPAEPDSSPVKISWYSDRPDVLDDDGLIQDREHLNGESQIQDPDSLISEDGSGSEEGADAGIPVTLTAELTCGEKTREVEYAVTVFPKKYSDEEETERIIRSAIKEGSDRTSSTVRLPSEIEGKSAVWKTVSDNTGALVLIMGIVIALFYIYSRIRLKELAENSRKEQLKRDYPDLVGKLVLLLVAGMSIRGAFAKIAEDYKKDLAAGGSARPAFDEICLTVRDMNHGVTEAAAYEELGRRCDLPLYRTFAALLAENLRKGGPGMRLVMEREAIDALEERRKTARVLGEQAGTKLLLPMVLMLAVVMIVLIAPSFLTFF